MSEQLPKGMDIIVPVFSGEGAVRKCLEALFASDAEQVADVILVNDASPEPAISSYLRQWADRPGVTLLAHEENKGFVESVNEATRIHPDRDFVILNADTEVSSDWLQRLLAHADSDSRVATVTPVSNNATIASYPRMGVENELPSGMDTATLDAIFARLNEAESVGIPTGVGFCMWLRRAAWTAAGGFDETFGRGYGEEVDLCCKLARDGWKHVLATDVFVFHQGGVSFGEEAAERKRVAQEIVDDRYPEFPEAVQSWIREDPAMPHRLRVDLARLNKLSGPRWLFVSHNFGGGVQQHIDDLASLIRDELDGSVWLLQPRDDASVRLRWLDESADLDIPIPHDQLSEATQLFAAQFGIQRLHFHHFAGLPQAVLTLPKHLGIPFDVTFHDFHSVCPQTHFITREGRFCGRPDQEVCGSCVADRPNSWGLDINTWRTLFENWLKTADRCICPAESVRDIVTEYFPSLPIEVWPHPERSLQIFERHLDRSLTRRKFALIGGLSDVKGLHRLKQIARNSLDSDAPIEFVVLGRTQAPLGADAPNNITVTGQFLYDDLANLLARERPDGVLFLSIVPETYNYALSAALATNLPIFALDAGAIGERLKGVDSATVLPLDASNQMILDALEQSVSCYKVGTELPLRTTQWASPADYIMALNSPLGDAETSEFEPEPAAQWDWVVALKKSSPPLRPKERSISELLEQSLDCGLVEATAQLRAQALQNERQLSERNAHVDAAEREINHLKKTIEASQLASESEVNDLKKTIEALQLASEREVNHLKKTIDALKVAQASEIHHLEGVIAEITELAQSRDALLMALGEKHSALQELYAQRSEHLAERERLITTLADRVREFETSTFWRMTAPARALVISSRRIFARLKRRYDLAKRLPVFIRYHYGLGGWRAVVQAADRRLRWRRKSHASALVTGPAALGPQASLDSPIHFSSHSEPIVSIVVPTYGEHDVTRRCLASLAADTEGTASEVIVIDDAFVEPFDADSMQIAGLKLIRNETNLGFLRSCNRAVAVASGDFVLLLNNDTVVHSGAITSLLATFEKFDNVGAVCAQLRFEDGSLQEAGGIVWRDGSAWNWGRGEDPADPRFCYPRDVDYGSAAALMVRRSLWQDIGGFDERFAPAYYEDTDFCFSVRRAGQRVVYQPQAVITHFEGVSHGTDTGAGMKAYQVTNQGRFAEKWSGALADHRANGVEPMLERDRNAVARVLWIEACLLTPDQDSGSLRTIRLLRILVRMGCKVTFVADNLDGAEPYRSQLLSEGIEVIHAPYSSNVEAFLRRHGSEFDVVTLCRHYIGIQHIDTVREVNPRAKIWFDTIDLHYLRLRRQFELDGKKSTKKQAELAYYEEMAVIQQADITVVVSEVEVDELSREAPAANVIVVSNIHEISETEIKRVDRRGVMFVGGFQHPPNVDAVEYYLEQIWPVFRKLCPDAPTYIIGSRMPDRLRQMGVEHGLEMLGFVEDLTPYYDTCALSIAPLRYGAGVKGKVNQALSFGLPVVGTPVALEGMGLIHGEHVLIESEPESFAAAMAEVYSDDSLWCQLSRNGRLSLEGRFTPKVAQDALKSALADFF
jgi:GT2 family glycosyltransferase/glycosyltransferase involved in cell wall biosynthesis